MPIHLFGMRPDNSIVKYRGNRLKRCMGRVAEEIKARFCKRHDCDTICLVREKDIRKDESPLDAAKRLFKFWNFKPKG